MKAQSFIFIGRDGCKFYTIPFDTSFWKMPRSWRNYAECAFYDIDTYNREVVRLNGVEFVVFCLEGLTQKEFLETLVNHLPNTFGGRILVSDFLKPRARQSIHQFA